MTDVAFELMSKKKKAIPFRKLWEEVVAIMGYSESVALNKLSTFYANMSLDTRFALVEDGKWDLRSRHTYNETHRDLSDILDDSDDENEFEDETEENEFDEEDEEKGRKDSYSSEEEY
ncbi:MAG: DNA-directed RNA polymerase subunit delta [Erysipelotrichales bacterium]|nr:DNA-directed RNA polymerase subunit delta [Erysipelotrichales bacterium]